MTLQEQKTIEIYNGYQAVETCLETMGIGRLLLVCGNSFSHLDIHQFFDEMEISARRHVVYFSDFTPNPQYDSVVKAVRLFQAERCDAVFAVGGGSALDVAKCVKLYANLSPEQDLFTQPIIPNSIPLLAMPTTAGTGSEATRFAVIYRDNEKRSVTHDTLIPSIVVFDPSALKSLPGYQRKSTMLDALCHAIESYWSVRSSDESKAFSRQAIQKILENQEGYLQNQGHGNAEMLKAANIAGRAINITQTTAGHAMCYKLTTLYGISHGHAAALCVNALWRWMLEHMDRCVDKRGVGYLEDTMNEIAAAMGCITASQASAKFQNLLYELALGVPSSQEKDFATLVNGVNSERLKNHPIALDKLTIDKLYHEILCRKETEDHAN